MPQMWMDVDTALSEVPVNLMPLIDDTDFKTIETGVVYNSAGMDLRWNFVTTAGATTSTAVTPTTAGVYDWTHQGDGMYTIEIPASGGASINNDTEGFGWFSGVATGILPWRGPVIGFRAAAINNALIDGGDNLDVNTVQVGGQTASASAAVDFDNLVSPPELLVSTTISIYSSQTVFRLTVGSADNDAYNGAVIVVTDQSTGTQKAVGRILDYAGASKQVTLVEDPGIFTFAVGDFVDVIAATGASKADIQAECDDALTAFDFSSKTVGAVSGAVGSVTGNVGGNVVGSVASVTGNVGGNVVGSVASVTAGVTVTTNNDKTGYSITGVLTTLDALDTAQDSQHSTTQSNIAALNNLSAAEVNAEVDTALTDIGLDHLFSAAVAGVDITDNSFAAKLTSNSATADFDDFDNTAHSLPAIRARGDAAWTTGGGGSISDILDIYPLIPTSIDLANTATVRLGLQLRNAVDDLPTTAEITPGTISIDRKAIGGTSWSAVVTDAACSETDGLIYYDEVFDSGSGYAEGDSIRITFKSQKITVAANDYEITGSGGVIWQTEVRQTMRGTDSALLASAAPTNWSSLAITGGGAVTVGTNSDKTGYSIAGTLNTLDDLAGDPGTTLASVESTLVADVLQVQESVNTIDGIVDLILVDTGTTIPAQITALNNISSADVLAQATAALGTYDPPTKAELDAGLAALNDPTPAAIAAAVWGETQSGYVTVGTFGYYLDSLVSAAGSGGLTAAAIADQVWRETLLDHSAQAGSTAEKLAAAGAAGDPWSTTLPGTYTPNQAGYIVGNNVDAPISSAVSALNGVNQIYKPLRPGVISIVPGDDYQSLARISELSWDLGKLVTANISTAVLRVFHRTAGTELMAASGFNASDDGSTTTLDMRPTKTETELLANYAGEKHRYEVVITYDDGRVETKYGECLIPIIYSRD